MEVTQSKKKLLAAANPLFKKRGLFPIFSCLEAEKTGFKRLSIAGVCLCAAGHVF
jgi:hypothetical protein